MGARHLLVYALLAVALLALDACQGSRNLKKANFDQVMEGMAKKQVESILELPTSVEVKELDLTKKTTFVYTQGAESATLIFWDDKLESMVSNFKD